MVKFLSFIWKILLKILKVLFVFSFQLLAFSKTFDIDELERNINDLDK